MYVDGVVVVVPLTAPHIGRRFHVKKSVLALLAVAGLAAVANAQGVDGQAGFSFSVPPAAPSTSTPAALVEHNPAVSGNVMTVQLLVGGFGGQHLGLLSWVGSIAMIDPAAGASITATSLRAPYNFGN